MLSLTDATPIYLYTRPTDMRKSFDGLCGLIAAHLAAETGHADVTRGGLFVFVNRRRDRIKVMYFDGDGLAIWYKRLEQGRYQLPVCDAGRSSVTIDARQLRLILDGIDLTSVRQRKRYTLPQARRNRTDEGRTTHRATSPGPGDDRRTDADGGQALG